MQLDKVREFGWQVAPVGNVVFLDRPRCQTLQVGVFQHRHHFVQRLASQKLSEGPTIAVDGIQMSSGVQQGSDYVRLGRFVRGGCVKWEIVFVVFGLNVCATFEEERDDLSRRELTDGVSTYS